LYKLSGRINRKWGKSVAKANSDFENTLLEGVNMASCLRHYNASGYAIGKLEARYAALSQILQKSAGAANMYETAVQGVSRLLVCLVLTVGTFYVFRGEISLGQLVGFYSLCSFFTVPLDDMTSSVNAMAKASVAGRRIYEILAISGDDDGAEKISPNGIVGDIVVDSIKFRYPGREMLFCGTSMVVEKGKITRIDGESGLGKSTLLKLIMGDYPLLEGSISYGGINISQFKPAQWRNMVTYVEQRTTILDASILENITLGEENPDMERILEICRNLNMDRMISGFPQGLLTNAGSSGMGLSGGECQKIGLARAIYRDSPIYIFDEATSSMDIASEECAARCIHHLRECGKTVIFISHKRECAIIADNVVQLK
jgi:ATP-binding cassette subfamily B protein